MEHYSNTERIYNMKKDYNALRQVFNWPRSEQHSRKYRIIKLPTIMQYLESTDKNSCPTMAD